MLWMLEKSGKNGSGCHMRCVFAGYADDVLLVSTSVMRLQMMLDVLYLCFEFVNDND